MDLTPLEWLYIVGVWLMAAVCGLVAHMANSRGRRFDMVDQFFCSWQFIVFENGQLWVNGVKRKSEEATKIVKAAIQAWNPEAEEGRGYLERRDEGFVFHPQVDWR